MIEVVKVKRYSSLFLFLLGLSLRIINKLRRTVVGYTSPRTFSSKEIERSVAYDLAVVKNWKEILVSYQARANPFMGQNVLELGPGPDLGIGVIVLGLGAKSYTAVDKNKLISMVPRGFYSKLLTHLQELPGYSQAKQTVSNLQRGNFSENFQYIWDPDFSFAKLCSKRFDLLVSQAVLEHIIDFKKTFRVLYNKLSPGAVMVHEVDLATHTGLIREVDPLNLLRYSDGIWNFLRFSGSPNRLRRPEYKEILSRLGFVKIKAEPIMAIDEGYIERTMLKLSKKFRKYSKEELGIKSFYLLATKE